MLKFLVIGKAKNVLELSKLGIELEKDKKKVDSCIIDNMGKWSSGRIPVYRLNY